MDIFLFFALGFLGSLANNTCNDLAAAHNELLAAQQFLGETIRSSERMRSARELYDSIGHHLTALNLHLDLATRKASDLTSDSLRTARELSQQLLANVRVAVSNERRDQLIDLRQALYTLCSGIPQPRVELSIDSPLEVETPHVAHALFCCAQESLTNAVRHANKFNHGYCINIHIPQTGAFA